jgi:hypothetical protein
VHPLCVEQPAREKEGGIGYQEHGVQGGTRIIVVTPTLLLHIHMLTLSPSPLLCDAPAAARNSHPDSRIAELPNTMCQGPRLPLPVRSLGSRSFFDASIKTHRVLFVHL